MQAAFLPNGDGGRRGPRFVVAITAADATELKIEMHADRAARLYASFCKAVTSNGDDIAADYATPSASADQALTINAASTPPLHAGTYYIAVSSAAGASFNLKATRDGGPCSSAGGCVLNAALENSPHSTFSSFAPFRARKR